MDDKARRKKARRQAAAEPRLQLRRARPSDAEPLAVFGAAAFADAFAADNTPDDMAAYLAEAFGPEIQAREIADPAAVVLLAEIDGALAGYAKLQTGAPPTDGKRRHCIELCRLYVSHELIGYGVGAALMQGSIDAAVELGGRALWLGVWERNERAVTFYKKWGFQTVGEQIFQLGSDPQRDWVMLRELPEPDGNTA